MDTLALIINWFGTFLLAIEAIRLSNFRKLTLKFMNLRIAVNAPFVEREDGTISYPKPAKGFRFISKIYFIIEYSIGLAIVLLLLKVSKLINFVFATIKYQFQIFFDCEWYIIILKIFILLIVIIIIPLIIGNSITRIFAIFADKYQLILQKLEEKIEKGTIGLIGFCLITIAFIINL